MKSIDSWRKLVGKRSHIHSMSKSNSSEVELTFIAMDGIFLPNYARQENCHFDSC